MKRTITLILSFYLFAGVVEAQNYHRIDSLKHFLTSSFDTVVVHNLLLLEIEYRNINIDSSFYYVNKALDIINKKHLDDYLVNAYNSLASDYKLVGDIKKAEKYYLKLLYLAQKNNDLFSLSQAYTNLGTLYSDIGQYKKALSYQMKSLEIAEKIKNLDIQGTTLNNIGILYYKIGDYDNALRYYNKSLKIRMQQKDISRIGLLYNNIGIVYYFKNDINKVFIYFNKALRIWNETKDKRQMALTLSNLGELHLELNHLNKALQYILQADAINEELKDKSSQIYTKSLLGDIYKKRSRYFEAKSFYTKALNIADELDSRQDKSDLYKKLSEVSELMGNIPEAYRNYKLYSQFKDSLLNSQKQKDISELQTKYETKKKEQEIELLNNKNKLSAAIQRNQRIVIFSLIIGLLLVLFMVFIIIKRNIERRKANELLARKNDEIAHQKEELTSSIAYAQRIQTAMLPQNQIMDASLSDYFIFFKPKDVVSGDFFWWTHFDKYTVISVSDCTGHGVPGAFMSILGVSFLREIVSKEGITHPGTILDRLRTEIITALNQKGISGEQKDGMDMSLITINHEAKELQYAGANNPLYIIKQGKLEIENESIKLYETDEHSNFNFYEIKPDKMPIAIYYKMKPFNTVQIPLQPGDQIYLFSDGYADQFGGSNGRKFKYQPFKDLLLKNADKPMQYQKEELKKAFETWKNGFDQIDDVTVTGIKI